MGMHLIKTELIFNIGDYTDRIHPPIIGFVFDGLALFGKYDEDYNEMDGFSEELDDFGDTVMVITDIIIMRLAVQ